MARATLLGGTTFAHLLGRAPKARAEDDRDEDEKDKKDSKRADDDGDDERPDDKKDDAKKGAKAGKAEDDDQGDDEKDKKKDAKRADDEDDDESMSEDDDEDEDDKKDKKDAKARAARGRERARCAAIFKSAAAAARPDFAAHLAFETSLGRKAAVGMLKAAAAGAAAPQKAGLSDRMRGMEGVGPGQDRAAAPTTRQTVNAGWDAAAKRTGIAR